MQFVVPVENVLLQSGKPEDEQRWGSQCTKHKRSPNKEYQMQGWRGVGLAQELESSAKKEKREQTFHTCSSNASKGILYLRIKGSWAIFYYLHPYNLANSKRPMYLLEGGKWPFLLVLRTPISYLSPASWAVSFILHTEPAAPVPCTCCLEVHDFLYNTSTEVVLPGLQKQALCFPRVWQKDQWV